MHTRRPLVVLLGTASLLVGLALPAAAAPTTGSVHGTVVDAAGKPLSGATVQRDGSDVEVTTTAADGTFTLRSLRPGEVHACVQGSTARGGTSTTGYLDTCSGPVEVIAGRTAETGRIALDPAGGISGRVTDEQGAPLQGVEVGARDRTRGEEVLTTTGANGRFSIINLVPDAYGVCFIATGATGGSSAQGYLDECWGDVATPNEPDPVVVTSGHLSTGLDPSLMAAAAVQGVVRDGAGRPITGATVHLHGPTTARVETDAAGHYTVRRLPSGSYKLCVDASQATGDAPAGYLDQCYDHLLAWHGGEYGAPDDATPFPVTSAHTATAPTMVLDPAAQIRGTVTDAAGRPIPNVRVQANPVIDNPRIHPADVTDAQGRYVLSVDSPIAGGSDVTSGARLLPGRYQLQFDTEDAPGYVSELYPHDYYINTRSPNVAGVAGTASPTTADAGTITVVDDQLATAGSLSGVVRDGTDGQPIHLVQVILRYGHDQTHTVRTDYDGSYRFTGMPVGDYSICYYSEVSLTTPGSPAGYFSTCGRHGVPTTGTAVHMDTGQTRTGVDVSLDRKAGLMGHTTDLEGHPIPNRRVTVSGTVDDVEQSGGDGDYFFRYLEPGTYTLCAHDTWVPARSRDKCHRGIAKDGTPTPIVISPGQVVRVDLPMGDLATPDTTAPTATLSTPSSLVQSSTQVTATYQGWDADTGVLDYDLRYRWAAWNGKGLSGYSSPTSWQHRTATTLTWAGTPGHTYCVSARARDAAGNLSAWTPDRCTTVPVDDAAIAVQGAWSRLSVPAGFAGTLSRTTVNGASMTLTAARARFVALDVTTCPSCGQAAVYLDGKLWRTISTTSATSRYQVLVPLPAFSLRTTTITVKSVLSAHQQLIVDGIGPSPV